MHELVIWWNKSFVNKKSFMIQVHFSSFVGLWNSSVVKSNILLYLLLLNLILHSLLCIIPEAVAIHITIGKQNMVWCEPIRQCKSHGNTGCWCCFNNHCDSFDWISVIFIYQYVRMQYNDAFSIINCSNETDYIDLNIILNDAPAKHNPNWFLFNS